MAGDLAGVAIGAQMLSQQLQSEAIECLPQSLKQKGSLFSSGPLMHQLNLALCESFPGSLSRQGFFYSALRTGL
jgi:hypothetical protein